MTEILMQNILAWHNDSRALGIDTEKNEPVTKPEEFRSVFVSSSWSIDIGLFKGAGPNVPGGCLYLVEINYTGEEEQVSVSQYKAVETVNYARRKKE